MPLDRAIASNAISQASLSWTPPHRGRGTVDAAMVGVRWIEVNARRSRSLEFVPSSAAALAAPATAPVAMAHTLI